MACASNRDVLLAFAASLVKQQETASKKHCPAAESRWVEFGRGLVAVLVTVIDAAITVAIVGPGVSYADGSNRKSNG